MRGVTRLLWGVILMVLVTGASAQDSGLIAPNIFLRGLHTDQGVRYSATFVKPSDDTTLRNVSVEITLPLNADFREMLLSRQIEFDVIRRSPQGQLTLIWQMSRVAADRALDAFAFTVAQPLADPLEFYMQWQDEAGTLHVENFYERPSLIDATQTDQAFSITQAGAQMLGSTGIQIIPPIEALPLSLSAHVLSQDFNPPPEYGDLWWCSLLSLDGLPAGTSALVIVPLRRPVAPFTGLAMFQQQSDGTWQALASHAIVTADGQFALYQHPGGVIATGGPEEIKQEALPVEQAVIVEVPTVPDPPPAIPAEPPAEVVQAPVEPPPAPIEPSPVPVEPQAPADAPTAAPIADGSSNTVVISENPSPVPVEPTALPPQPTTVAQDASSGTVFTGQKPTSAPGIIIQPTIAPFVPSRTAVVSTSTLPPFLSPVPSATNNKAQGITIVSSTGTPTPPIIVTDKVSGVTSSGSTPLPTLGPAPTLASVIDGSSNTILVGERTRQPTAQFGDGSVRTIGTGTPLPTLASAADGSSNTILIGERTQQPTTEFGDGTVRTIGTGTPLPTLASVVDGSSNTILIGESTRQPTAQFGDGTVRTIGTGTPLPTLASVADGSSNTILIGEHTATAQFGDGTVRTIGTGTPLPTLASITDGSSNTILIGERTRQPTAQFGDGTVRTIGTGTPLPTLASVADGSSNTILIGEHTATAQFGDGTVRTIGTGTPLPTLAPFLSPTPSATRNKTEGVTIVGSVGTPTNPPILVTGKAGGITASSTPRPSATLAPTATRTPAPTPTVVQLAPGVIINPPTLPETILPFGGGGSRVEITGVTNTKMTQCSAGGISCAVVVRVTGKGTR